MNYLATFHTHYGALQFNKYCQKNKMPSKMAPVPRGLSASCGVCVYFDGDYTKNTADHEDMDCCYTITASGNYEIV
ncbi:MAG: DUF3343 domain-containing protein [Oscillospiraceae bacterium]|nr:DUF3343 domain-containing protein [Oscillospiraceae bacterium]